MVPLRRAADLTMNLKKCLYFRSSDWAQCAIDYSSESLLEAVLSLFESECSPAVNFLTIFNFLSGEIVNDPWKSTKPQKEISFDNRMRDRGPPQAMILERIAR